MEAKIETQIDNSLSEIKIERVYKLVPSNHKAEKKEIFVTRSSMPPIEEYIEEIRKCWDTHVLTNMGTIYKKLQHQLIDYLEVDYLSLFTNGHMALELGLEALDLKGGEVITTPFTFVSTTHAIVRNGLTPVFCDIDPHTYTMDVSKIEELITGNTVAIMPVHVYGNVCDVEAIEKIAAKYNLKVIYDAAHAFGVKYKGKGIGNYGDMSMFSFHATKVFNTIEGGAIAFSNEEYRKKLHIIKNFGITGQESIECVGANAKMDEFRAAMGVCNLRHVEEEIEKRKKVYERYVSHLHKIDGIRLMEYREDVEANYAYMPVYFDREVLGFSRDDVYETLLQHGIRARKYFYPLTNEIEVYKECRGETPVAHDVGRSILALPMYADLTMTDVDRICNIVPR